jgi:hypothetical protein
MPEQDARNLFFFHNSRELFCGPPRCRVRQFLWSCLKENCPSIGLAQGRRVVPLAVLKGDGSFTWSCSKEDELFSWLSLRKKGNSFGHVQRRRVIPLVVPKGKWSLHWPCSREKGGSLSLAQGRWVIYLVVLKGR